MAYVSAKNVTGPTLSVNTVTLPDLPNEAGDLLVMLCSIDGSGTWSAPGNTRVSNGTEASSLGGVGAEILYKISSGTNESFATATASRADNLAVIGLVIKDVPASAVLEGYATPISVTGKSEQWPALSTGEDDCLILYPGFYNRNVVFAANGLELLETVSNNQVGIGCWVGFQKSLGSVFRPEALRFGNDTGQLWTVAIKSSASNPVQYPAGAAKVCTELSNIHSTETWADPTLEGLTSITDGAYTLTLTYSAPASGYVSLGRFSLYGGTFSPPNSGTYNECATSVITPTDITGKICVMHTFGAFSDAVDISADPDEVPYPFGLRSVDGTGKAYRIFSTHASVNKTVPDATGKIAALVFDPEDTSYVIDSVGTFDITQVDGIFCGYHRGTDGGTTNNAVVYNVSVAEDAIVDMGGATFPADFLSFYKIIEGSGLVTAFNHQAGVSDNQVSVMHPCKIGNESGDLYFDANAQSLNFIKQADRSIERYFLQAGTGKIGLKVVGVAGETVKIRNSLVNFDTPGYINYLANCSPLCNWDHSSTIYRKADPLVLRYLGAGGYDGLTLVECAELTHNGADLGGVTIDACTGAQAITITGATQAALQTAMDLLGDSTWTNDAVAIRIEYTGSTDISLTADNIQNSGNTKDVEFNATHVDAPSCTIVQSNGANMSQAKAIVSGTATAITISNDVTGTFTGLLAGSSVTVIEDMSAWSDWVISTVYAANAIVRSATDGLWYQTAAGGTSAGNDSDLAGGSDTGVAWVLYSIEDFHVESSGTSEAWSFTAPLGHSFDYYVVKAGYDPVISTGNAAFTSDSTFAIVQKAVPIYA